MDRRIERRYFFSEREIREILVAHLKAKDVPAPDYVGDTPTCKWENDPLGVYVTWTDESQIEL